LLLVNIVAGENRRRYAPRLNNRHADIQAALLLGFGTTIAEPALIAVANEAADEQVLDQ